LLLLELERPAEEKVAPGEVLEAVAGGKPDEVGRNQEAIVRDKVELTIPGPERAAGEDHRQLVGDEDDRTN